MLLGCLVATFVLTLPAIAADYDLVINNGRVMDPETMFDDVANVGITKDRTIVAISKATLKARKPSTPPGMW